MPKPTDKPVKPVKPAKGTPAPVDTARLDAIDAQLLTFESRLAALESSMPSQANVEAPVIPE